MTLCVSGKLDNVRVDIARKGGKSIQYTLPQTSIPTIEIMGHESKLYRISCSADAEEVGDLELQWRFLKLDHKSPTGFLPKSEEIPGTEESQEGVQLMTHSATSSKFRITVPSVKLDGLYYCEWTTATAVLRSPAFNLRILGS